MTCEQELRYELKKALEKNDILESEVKDMRERLDTMEKLAHAMQQSTWKKDTQEMINPTPDQTVVYITSTSTWGTISGIINPTTITHTVSGISPDDFSFIV